MNRLFQEMGQNSIFGKFKQFMQNPMQYLMESRMNVPPQYQNDPKAAFDYLVQTGQIDQNNVNKVMNMAQQMGIKLR